MKGKSETYTMEEMEEYAEHKQFALAMLETSTEMMNNVAQANAVIRSGLSNSDSEESGEGLVWLLSEVLKMEESLRLWKPKEDTDNEA